MWKSVGPALDELLAKASTDGLVLPADAGGKLRRSDVSRVLLAGGAVRVPKIATSIKALLPDAKILAGVPPDEAGALGAATQAARLVLAEDGTFIHNYKKSTDKLHKQVRDEKTG